MESLELCNISHSFGDIKIVDSISFSVQRGEIVSLLGTSGCGKTTILKICANLLKQSDGEVKDSFKKSSFVFEEPRLLPWQNLLENISLVLKDTKLTKTQRDEKAKKIALDMGLKEQDFKKYVKDLSAGMKQRVSLARALVAQPAILFLDEPFSALDVGLKNELYSILEQKVRDENLAILFITHDLIEAVVLSDKVMLLRSQNGGSQIVKRYSYEIDREKRDHEFIYVNMLKLKDDIIFKKDR